MAELKIFEFGGFFNVLINASSVNYRLGFWANGVEVCKTSVPLMWVCMSKDLENKVIVGGGIFTEGMGAVAVFSEFMRPMPDTISGVADSAEM